MTSSTRVDGIQFVRFGGEDVVRHKLVQRIVEAYDAHTQRDSSGVEPAPRSGGDGVQRPAIRSA